MHIDLEDVPQKFDTLAKHLKEYQQLVLSEEDDEEKFMFRLQYHDHELLLHKGNPQYDTDHRGSWGSSLVRKEDDLDDIKESLRTAYKDLKQNHAQRSAKKAC